MSGDDPRLVEGFLNGFGKCIFLFWLKNETEKVSANCSVMCGMLFIREVIIFNILGDSTNIP